MSNDFVWETFFEVYLSLEQATLERCLKPSKLKRRKIELYFVWEVWEVFLLQCMKKFCLTVFTKIYFLVQMSHLQSRRKFLLQTQKNQITIFYSIIVQNDSLKLCFSYTFGESFNWTHFKWGINHYIFNFQGLKCLFLKISGNFFIELLVKIRSVFIYSHNSFTV